MRLIIRQFLFFLVFIASGRLCYAQASKCNGALGDPVIDEDFGAGTNPGPQLGLGITNMEYTTNNCPNDGQYTIYNSLTGAGNCHPETWYNIPTDHTGNPNGYMMIINASYQPSIFFYQQAKGLCPNTTYEFSAWIINLCIPGFVTASYSQPNITFTIQASDGNILATDTTGTIQPTPYNQEQQRPNWVKYGVYFTTPANVSDVTVVMTNNAPGGNGNDFIMDDITFRACGPIIEEGFSTIGGSKNRSLCQGGSATYTLKTKVISEGVPALQWQASSTTSPWTDVPGATADSLVVPFTNASPNVYQYRLGVSNGSVITDASCRVYSQPLSVYVNPLPVVSPFPDQKVCEGDQLVLNATGGGSYTWTGPGLAPTSENPLVIGNVSPANAGTYTVVAVSDSGCTAPPVQAKVTVVPKVVPGISGNVAICAGESTQLNATGGLYYRWTPSTGLDNDTLANPTATPLQTTTYTAHISNGGCVDSSKSVTVTVNQNPVANAGNEIFLYEGQSAKLNGTIKGDNITQYYWTPATFLDDPNSLTPTTTPTENITYTLTAVSQSCGTSTSSVYVRVYKKVTIPNAFSPNNDGINDYWNITALNTYPESITQVFNRYGQQVFQSTGYARPWDGTNNGKPLPAGTYYYIIDLKDGQHKLSGWVLVVK
ncbi:MAG TPA: gliding motility-associated C-terminal domain-containing protein [Mucilaginibacter sp.]|jgi:gliding motility-associated-like protein|nr:gliding motility-associated C-terminal domain-containing protein [Mucilaginibacter sp.]